MTKSTRTITVWTCRRCGQDIPEDVVIDHSAECQGVGSECFYNEVEVPRLAVGDEVRLHHAKSKDRKIGYVVAATATWATIQTWIHDDITVTTRRRRQDDSDVKRANH